MCDELNRGQSQDEGQILLGIDAKGHVKVDCSFSSPKRQINVFWMDTQKAEIALAETARGNFSFLKNSLAQIDSKLNSKPFDNLYIMHCNM